MAWLTWRLSSMVLVTSFNFWVVDWTIYNRMQQLSLFYTISYYLTWSSMQEWKSVSCFSFYSPLFAGIDQWQYFISCYFVSLCSMLPDTLLTCHMYAQFISLYRQLLTEVTMDEGRDSQDAGNYITTLCVHNDEASCSSLWLLLCSFRETNLGLNL